MGQTWEQLRQFVGGSPLVVERVRATDSGIAVEGQFEPPPLSRLSADDQVFVAAFVRSHGSIKQMEQLFGVSYPTIKNRLNRIGEQLDFVKVRTTPSRRQVLDELEAGNITADEALRRMKE